MVPQGIVCLFIMSVPSEETVPAAVFAQQNAGVVCLRDSRQCFARSFGTSIDFLSETRLVIELSRAYQS